MKIIVVEDSFDEIGGYLSIFDLNKWKYERFRTFSDAYTWLAEERRVVDLFWLDIMLPWGKDVVEEIDREADWKKAGLYLIYAIRGIKNDTLEKIITDSGLSKLKDYYKDVPIIALTKVSESVREELSAVPGVYLASKLIGLDTRNLGSFISEICGKKGE